MGSRRKARELALQALYGLEFPGKNVTQAVLAIRGIATEPPSEDEELQTLVRAISASGKTVDDDVLSFAERLIRGVHERRAELDAIIGKCSTNWRVTRMALIDRNILRIACFELRFLDDIPKKVSLNEAIDIGKKYGTAESGAFINGILDRVAQELTRSDAAAG